MAEVTNSARATHYQMVGDTDVECITVHAVVKIAQLARHRIYVLMKQDRFPCSHKVFSGGVRWRRSEVEAWAAGTWRAPNGATAADLPQGAKRGPKPKDGGGA